MSRSKGSPPPGQRLISGVEPHQELSETGEEQWRIYVGSRWAWKYVLVPFDQAQVLYRIWQSVDDELWAPISEEALIYTVPVEERRDSLEDEKIMFYRVQELMRRGLSE